MLDNKTIIITGASRGIGRAIAAVCAREGAVVGINYLQSKKIACDFVDELNRKRSGSAFLIPFDVRDSESIAEACRPLIDSRTRIDGWVNNAAIHLSGLLLSQTDRMIQDQISTNLVGTLYCCRFILPCMMNQKGGSIVNIGSIAGARAAQGQAVYAACKQAIAALTRSLAYEYGRKRIRINCVQPGPIQSDMTKQILELAGAQIQKQIPLRRFGTAEEVAELVAFLLSDRASFLTGGVFTSDGGYSL